MKSLASISRRSQASIAALALVAGAIALAPAQAAAPVAGKNVLRLVDPVLTDTNSKDMTFDAKQGNWDVYYAKNLRFFFFYQNVRSTMNLTWKATNAAGAPLVGRTVYLIVNKYGSCSETTFTTTNPMQFGNPDNDEQVAQAAEGKIGRDWCGDSAGGHPQWGSGESSLRGTTDSAGFVTFNLTNTNPNGDAEPAPVSLTQMNPYSPKSGTNDHPCADPLTGPNTGAGCLATTITASLVQHPQIADDQVEDKDLLNIHFVNNRVTNNVTSVRMSPTVSSKTLGFTVTNLGGTLQAGVTLNFSNVTGIGTLSADSAVTDADGYAEVSVSPDCSDCTGTSKVRATVDGTTSQAQSTVIWADVPPPVDKPSAAIGVSVFGTAKVTKSLTGRKGTWTGAPTYSYKWYTCRTSGYGGATLPGDCTAITGATSTSFKLTTKQKGKYIRFVTTARNAGGSTISVSATSSKVS